MYSTLIPNDKAQAKAGHWEMFMKNPPPDRLEAPSLTVFAAGRLAVGWEDARGEPPIPDTQSCASSRDRAPVVEVGPGPRRP